MKLKLVAESFNEFSRLNENQNINIDGYQLPIIIIKKENWAEGKTDPTEFSDDDNIVRIREDYDYKKDPVGWMRHEAVHHKLFNTKEWKDDGKEYPFNNTEQKAYEYQFKHLQKKGYKNLKDVPGLGKDSHKNILQKYWNNVKK